VPADVERFRTAPGATVPVGPIAETAGTRYRPSIG
jgi:hypothetical protein